MNATGMKTIYPIGTQFIKQGRKRKDIETVVDILTTTNSKGEVVAIRYIATHDFMGQKIADRDVVGTTIARGLLNKIEGA